MSLNLTESNKAKAKARFQFFILVYNQLSTTLTTFDAFGTTILGQTTPELRSWWSKWDNGKPRSIKEGTRDPYDSSLYIKESKNCYVDGKGILTFKDSNNNRPYVVDKDFLKQWLNVEMTVYAYRVSDYSKGSDYNVHQLRLGARSNHFIDDINGCPASGRGYHGEFNFNNTIYCRKEIWHPKYATKQSKISWTFPFKKWVGCKVLVRNCDNNTHVNTQVYRDLTDGLNGGTWTKVSEYTDKGGWTMSDSGERQEVQDWINKSDSSKSKCKYGDNTVLTKIDQIFLAPAYGCYLRLNNINEIRLKKFSCKEVLPLP